MRPVPAAVQHGSVTRTASARGAGSGTSDMANEAAVVAGEEAGSMIVVDVRDMPPEQWRWAWKPHAGFGGNGRRNCIFEQWIAPGAGAPTHSHPVEEVLTVRDGEAEM